MDIRLGDCIEVMRTLPDNSVDSIVTDPPYGIGMMNKEWDSPKKHKELIDRETKRSQERFDEGKSPVKGGFSKGVQPGLPIGGAKEGRWFQEWCELWATECLRVLKPGGYMLSFSSPRTYHRMATAFEEAGFQVRDQLMWVFGSGFPKSRNIGKKVEDYKGWGTALKPAHEPICMVRKPLSEKTIVNNVLKHGTGGINIDGSRIGFKDEADKESAKPGSLNATGENSMFGLKSGNEQNEGGRFPANIMFDEEAGKLLDEQSGIKEYNKGRKEGNYKGGHRKEYVGTVDNDIEKKIEGQFFSDKGGASRFFYCPKVSKKERGDGNVHPTVKPIKLMEYLITLITPKGGTVLEPFMGSGSTGIAAKNLGFNFIGIEKEQEYLDIAKQRIGE